MYKPKTAQAGTKRTTVCQIIKKKKTSLVKGKVCFIFAVFPLTKYNWRVNVGGVNVDPDLWVAYRQLSRGLHLKN